MTTNTSIPLSSPDLGQTRVIEQSDGFYWQNKFTDELYGPFPTRLEAVQDLLDQNNTSLEESESLEEAEAEIGISDWTDPDTGEPAEGSGPHLREE